MTVFSCRYILSEQDENMPLIKKSQREKNIQWFGFRYDWLPWSHNPSGQHNPNEVRVNNPSVALP